MLRLLDIREDNDLKQKDIAKILYVSRVQYSRLETGFSKITHDKLITLANFYNTNIDYLLGLTNEIKPYPKNNNKEIKLKLKELRKNKNINEKEIGKTIGISQQQYSSIEKGEYKITYDKLIKLSKYYETSTDYILGLTNKTKRYPKPTFEIE